MGSHETMSDNDGTLHGARGCCRASRTQQTWAAVGRKGEAEFVHNGFTAAWGVVWTLQTSLGRKVRELSSW